MLLYRISREKYAKRLTASGVAGRWNLNGEHVLYTSQSRSLAALELLAQRSAIRPKDFEYKVMVIEWQSKKSSLDHIGHDELPEHWRTLEAYPALQKMGSLWYQTGKNLVLKVPSVLIPQEHNYVINFHHPDFTRSIALHAVEGFFWDKRLL